MPAAVKVFLGWSGPRSHAVATALADWLPAVIQAVEPWISVEIDRGAQWFQNIGSNLKAAQYGIICVTPENAREPWVLFEAGALAMATDRLACPYLLGMAPAELQPPLSHLQAAKADKDDTWRVVMTINGLLADDALSEPRVRQAFDQWWPHLEQRLNAAKNIAVAAPARPQRSDADKLDEILAIARDLQRGTARVIQPSVATVAGDPTRAALLQSLVAGMGYNNDAAIIAAQSAAQQRGLAAILGASPQTLPTTGRPLDEPSKPAPSAGPRADVHGKIGKPQKPS